ncbi:arginyl-tRNA--protein transferase 1 isoform X2 [Bactrocera neohumeralis]|uniref:arginyl-tRNA--protein transferase 1 isoform X2 n=1 Tax=Bactrocera tryoni TaxID=59916 RepID=UPI001A970434|nr:arginyl-tRNA--protein transferase 1 isoform X2 [Bactrocera tryoni]XP_050323924.1 arginyl-tRNA--protein transferase 1 isoform X2 [Bactrocera neohumeralis]
MEFTINHYFSKQSSRCGYCKGLKTSVSHGMHSYTMFPQDYQELIDRGWRRSGLYCYKPLNNETCCPCYTIKCDALEFKLTKSHKKILKRMTRFLRDGKKDKNEDSVTSSTAKQANADDGAVGGADNEMDTMGGINDEPREPNLPITDVDLAAVAASNPEKHEAARKKHEHFDDQTVSPTQSINTIPTESADVADGQIATKKSHDGINVQRKKAKILRLERRQAKIAAKGVQQPEDTKTTTKKQRNAQEKTLADYFADVQPNDKHKLQVILIPPNKKHVTDEAFNLYKKYQLLVHNDDPNRLTPSSLERFCYMSPVKHTKTRDGPTVGYGSFHQQYWLDDKLIAVAVIDILPYCVSSVYFFYDPDYSFLSLGTYGSLREIDLVQQLADKVPALKYYYMGFYIHSCPKMRYKGRLTPSYLLCPEVYTWHLLTDEIRDKLNQNKYQRFNENAGAKDAEDFQESDLNKAVLLYDKTYLTYRQYIQSLKIPSIDNMLDVIRSRIYKKITGDDDDRDLIIEYGKLVGKSLAHRMLYVKT